MKKMVFLLCTLLLKCTFTPINAMENNLVDAIEDYSVYTMQPHPAISCLKTIVKLTKEDPIRLFPHQNTVVPCVCVKEAATSVLVDLNGNMEYFENFAPYYIPVELIHRHGYTVSTTIQIGKATTEERGFEEVEPAWIFNEKQKQISTLRLNQQSNAFRSNPMSFVPKSCFTIPVTIKIVPSSITIGADPNSKESKNSFYEEFNAKVHAFEKAQCLSGHLPTRPTNLREVVINQALKQEVVEENTEEVALEHGLTGFPYKRKIEQIEHVENLENSFLRPQSNEPKSRSKDVVTYLSLREQGRLGNSLKRRKLSVNNAYAITAVNSPANTDSSNSE